MKNKSAQVKNHTVHQELRLEYQPLASLTSSHCAAVACPICRTQAGKERYQCLPSWEETEPLQVVASLVPGRLSLGRLSCPEASKKKREYGHALLEAFREQRPSPVACKGLASEELKGKAAASSVSSDSQQPSISKMWQLSVLTALDKASSPCPGQSRFKLPAGSTPVCKYMRLTGA